MSNNTGGPAFPGLKLTSAHGNMTSAKGSEYTPIGGMTLRDYFAAKALAVIYMDADDDEHSAQRAYELADAMLKARKSWTE